MKQLELGLRFRLRKATEVLHMRLEKHLNLDFREASSLQYVALLAGFYGLYAPIERALSRLDWRGSGIDFAERAKRSWIESDLADFGFKADALAELPQSQNIPQPDTILDGLGVLYVLEGSTLGGQFIMRRLAGRFCVSPVFGGRFFSSYGPRVGLMWRGYVDAIERTGRTSDAADAIERSAVLAFQTFESWLSDAAIRTEIEALVEARIDGPGRRVASSRVQS